MSRKHLMATMIVIAQMMIVVALMMVVMEAVILR
jgi:hypothetical protein